jgi:predicted small lipoprotein YifL
MKKIFFALALLLTVMIIPGCGNDDKPTDGNGTEQNTDDDMYRDEDNGTYHNDTLNDKTN